MQNDGSFTYFDAQRNYWEDMRERKSDGEGQRLAAAKWMRQPHQTGSDRERSDE